VTDYFYEKLKDGSNLHSQIFCGPALLFSAIRFKRMRQEDAGT